MQDCSGIGFPELICLPLSETESITHVLTKHTQGTGLHAADTSEDLAPIDGPGDPRRQPPGSVSKQGSRPETINSP
jgi:hypothetical protein